LGRYSGPVIVGVADGHVSLVGNGHHNEDGDGQDDVGHGVDEVGERLAVQVEVQVQASDDRVVQNGHPNQNSIHNGQYDQESMEHVPH